MVEIRSGCGHVLPAMAEIVDVATPCGWCGAERRRIKAAEILAMEWAADAIDSHCGEGGLCCEKRGERVFHDPRCRRLDADCIRAEIERRKGDGA